VFSAKELAVHPGAEVMLKDSGAYGIITIQGHGTINDIAVESSTLIRFGDLTNDEFFVPYPAAAREVSVKNEGNEPLVNAL